MRTRRSLVIALSSLALFSMLAAAFAFIHVGGAHAASSSAFTRTISLGGTSSFASAAPSGDVLIQNPEIPAGVGGETANGGGGGGPSFSGVDRSFSRNGSALGSAGQNLAKTKSNPELVTSFDGLNFRGQRLANGGNQFSVEPPDQGLCAGNGFVMESLNDVLQVYSPAGAPQLNNGHAVDLNTFYGYPAAFQRPSGPFGQFVTDPSCYYDTNTQRWFQLVLTLEVNPVDGPPDFTGENHLDLAVSQTSDPRGQWNIYRIPVQDNGTAGTPDHGCSFGFCLGDYPHIGADSNGIYLTTNEYSFFGPEFHGAQIYAISKSALAAGASSIIVTQFDTRALPGFTEHPGFTVWPATSPAGQFDGANGGTEYFLSSTAADEVQQPDGTTPGTRTSNNIVLWTLSNTSSLTSSAPSLSVSTTTLGVTTYAAPQRANQKAGDFPLGQCLNDSKSKTFPVGGTGRKVSCAAFLLGAADPFAPEVEGPLDSNDTRMQQVTYANGELWGALDTAVTINGHNLAGIAYYIVNPHSSSVTAQGVVGLDGNNLIYPAIGVTASGRGVMAFTLVGNDFYPSAAYASIDALAGVGAIHVAQAGAGPQDGFSEYRVFSPFGNGVARPRWGDYGYTAVDGNTIWMASEYIGQTCDLATYEGLNGGAFGSCGGTRAILGNWDTRISAVQL